VGRARYRSCATSTPVDSELRLVAALRRAARELAGPLPSIAVADALLDEHRELTEWATTSGIFTISDLSSAEAFTLPSTNRPVWRVGRRMCEDRQMIHVDLPHTEGIPEIVRSFAA
jgi:hypothetical protein